MSRLPGRTRVTGRPNHTWKNTKRTVVLVGSLLRPIAERDRQTRVWTIETSSSSVSPITLRNWKVERLREACRQLEARGGIIGDMGFTGRGFRFDRSNKFDDILEEHSICLQSSMSAGTRRNEIGCWDGVVRAFVGITIRTRGEYSDKRSTR